MKNLIFFSVIGIIAIVAVIFSDKKNENMIKIGIIEPLQHQAMDDIVQGFSQTFNKNYNKKFKIKVENAQNDSNLLRSIFQKMKDAQYDLIVPIGTAPTQMALSVIHDRPIVSLASTITEVQRSKLNPCHLAVVHDEIAVNKTLELIHKLIPGIKELSLVHSSSDKVLPEVNKAIEVGKNYGISVNHYMVSNLPDLMSTVQSIPKKSQGILVLKDHLIVSGMATLSHFAAQRHIPIISSDEGSVHEGASFALGVQEQQIGVEGALLAIKILQGQLPCDLPIQEMNNLNVFLNKKIMLSENLSLVLFQQAAQALNYKSVIIQ